MLKSMAGAVRTHLHQLSTDRLDDMAAVGAVRPQLLDQLYDEENSVRSPHGIHAETTRVHIPFTHT
jgi:hypothetical protein